VTAKKRTARRAGAAPLRASAVRTGGRTVELTNAEKVLFPGDGFTKADLAGYYQSVAKWMLPHLRERPVAMERFPDGIDGMRLFQKNASKHFPEWITRARVPKVGGTVEHVIVDQAATLVYLANQACITLHGFLSRLDKLQNPDLLIFDLDPPGSDFALARQVALDLRGILEDELGLTSFVKTTGGDGLHVVLALDRASTFDAVRAFAREVAGVLVQRDPKRVTTEQRVGARGKRLYVDVMRNAYAQTAVVPYTVRARPGATVAMPVSWDEVADARLRPDRYTIENVPALLEEREDPWRRLKRSASALR
jgi:bifunctional non-homologous end joining protein LigD